MFPYWSQKESVEPFCRVMYSRGWVKMAHSQFEIEFGLYSI